MARAERTVKGDFQTIVKTLHDAVMNGSMSASYEDGSEWNDGGVRVAVRVFERYSFMGSNRVSLNLTLVGQDGRLFLSAITSGGSQAVFWKVNTIGEESFLECVEKLAEGYAAGDTLPED